MASKAKNLKSTLNKLKGQDVDSSDDFQPGPSFSQSHSRKHGKGKHPMNGSAVVKKKVKEIKLKVIVGKERESKLKNIYVRETSWSLKYMHVYGRYLCWMMLNMG